MSAALSIRGTRDYLRKKHGWDYKTCGIQPNAEPPTRLMMANHYVALDDAGVDTEGGHDSDYLKEFPALTVGIWIKPGATPKDMLGNFQMPDDVYLSHVITLADLERSVIVDRLGGLHKSYECMNAVNAQFVLPNDNHGAEFRMPFVYRGRSKIDGLPIEGTETVVIGYKLRFKGMMRLQKNRGTIG